MKPLCLVRIYAKQPKLGAIYRFPLGFKLAQNTVSLIGDRI
jgi:hypothetical protein